MSAGTLAAMKCAVDRPKEEKNWEWMDAAEDNERRMMLSRPSLVPCAPQAPSGVQSGLQPSARARPLPAQRSMLTSVHAPARIICVCIQ